MANPARKTAASVIAKETGAGSSESQSGELMDTQRLILRILRVFYQGYRLIVTGLKKEIDALEENLSEPTDPAKTVSNEPR